MPPTHPQFIAHYYSDNSDVPKAAIISSSRDIITSATHSEGWTDSRRQKHSLSLTKEMTLNAFTLARSPPRTQSEIVPPVLKEWGASVEAHEMYAVQDLEEFICTDLTFLFELHARKKKTVAKPAQSVVLPVKEASLPTTTPLIPLEQKADLPPPKTPPVHPPILSPPRALFREPLHSFLPPPFIFSTTSEPPLFPKTSTKYTHFKLTSLLPDGLPFVPEKHARVAWVIPIRGVHSLPIPGASDGCILDASDAVPYTAGNEIQWTKEAIIQFWQFLVKLRNTAGSVGVSFQPAAIPRTSSLPSSNSSKQTPSSGDKPITTNKQVRSADKAQSAAGGNNKNKGVPLRQLDYFKVYHDADQTMVVRNILHVFTVKALAKPTTELIADASNLETLDRLKMPPPPVPGGIKLLLGAKLVLVDGRGEGIMFC